MATKKADENVTKHEPGISEAGEFALAMDTTTESRPAPKALTKAAMAEAELTKATPAEPEHKPAPIALHVWALTSGLKPDQTAGFRHFARKQKLGPRTSAEWAQVYRDFSARPV